MTLKYDPTTQPYDEPFRHVDKPSHMTFDDALLELPEDWAFSHLMALEPSGFQCNLINSTERVCVSATGDTPYYAITAAAVKACDASNFLSLYDPSDHASNEPVLRTSLDIAKLFFKPREPMRRPK